MAKEILKYMDFFGTEFTFYSDGQKQRYTPLGGILTIFTFILYLIGTVFINLEDFKQNNPIIIKSELPFNKSNKIIINSNKIWIPWRIANKNNSHENNLESIAFNINYFSNKEKNINENLNITNKLCNETSIKITEEGTNNITVPLDLLYCTEIDLNFFYDNYMVMNISLFDNNFFENDQNNDSREEIFKTIKNNDNELKIEIYFPIIKYQPINKKNPVYIEYKKRLYYFSENTYKIDYLFLQEHIFNDNTGLLIQKIKNTSFWGLNTLNSDYYYIKEGKKLYSLNIYLNSSIVYYQRSYKKLYYIFTDSFPLFCVLFLVFEKISKIFKSTEDKKVIFESLFENIGEKPDKFAEFQNKISQKKSQIDENRSISHNNILLDKNSNNCSMNNINEGNINNISIILHKNEIQKRINNNILISHVRKNHIIFNPQNSPENLFSRTPKARIPHSKYNSFSQFNLRFKQPNVKVIKYKKKILFPYKYYLFSIFCRNITAGSIKKIKHSKYFKKFLNINIYIGKFLDITNYVCLHKEFRVMKEKIFNKKNINLLEEDQKININDQFSMNTILKDFGSRNEQSIL